MEHVILGISEVFGFYNILFCIVGLVVGIVFGALPGFSATMGVAVFVPFSYVMEAEAALLLLSGIYCGAIYGGSIPAILLGIPGTPASLPTAMEGKALTQSGQSGRSLAAVTYASSVGGFISSIVLLVFAPLLAAVTTKIGPPEQMMIAIFGLSVVCTLSKGNMIKGIFVGSISLLIATIGQDPVMGYPRFTFGFYQLSGGLEVVSILIGLFSIPEVLKLLEHTAQKKGVNGDSTEQHQYGKEIKPSKLVLSVKEIRKNIINVLRSSAIGIGIGIIPAAGPDIASFFAYNEAKKSSKNPQLYGKGSIEGIMASESANNGVTGGSLIPLLTLGIPGSAPAAIFLGAMIIHGLRPGPLLFTQNAGKVYTVLVGFALINVFILFIGWWLCKFSNYILRVPKAILAVVIVVLAVVGSFSIQQNMFDVVMMFIAGIVGYCMVKYNYPLAPVALALLLGPLLEESIMLTKTIYGNNWLDIFMRPVTFFFLLLTIVSLLFPFVRDRLNKKRNKKRI